MKIKLISIFCLLILSASTCKKEGVDCHRQINILNNSNSDIISAIPILNPDAQCRLDGSIVSPGNSHHHYGSRDCIEDELANGATRQIYIVDPSNFNDQSSFYSCDSIEEYNKVLKHYILTLDDLKNSDFTIIYP